MDLYLVAVILQPTKKQKDEEGVSPIVVVQPQGVMANSDAQAAMKAFKLVPEEHAKHEDRLDVKVLPFRSVAVLTGSRS